jgi:phosphoribosylformylglycinamidine synthase
MWAVIIYRIDEDIVYSLKAETHNFPTTVEPFYGAATGSGGEIRDRMAGGIGSIPLVGTAVYMVADTKDFIDEKNVNQHDKGGFLYHNPVDILIKASNGASDFVINLVNLLSVAAYILLNKKLIVN